MEKKKFYKKPWLYITVAASAIVIAALAVIILTLSFKKDDLDAQIRELDQEMLYSAVLPPAAEPWYQMGVDQGTAVVMHDKFPNVSFHCDGTFAWTMRDDGENKYSIYVSGTYFGTFEGENTTKRNLFVGDPICEVYFCDVNSDGYPEVCATLGAEERSIIICDYKNEKAYRISDPEKTDYKLHFTKGRLYIISAEYGKDDYNVISFLHNFNAEKYGLPTEKLSLGDHELIEEPIPTARQVFYDSSKPKTVIDDRFPDVMFSFSKYSVSAHPNGEDPGSALLISDMLINEGYLADINGDGCPEVCVNTISGSEIEYHKAIICDYKNGYTYTCRLSSGIDNGVDRGYELMLIDNVLHIVELSRVGEDIVTSTILTRTLLEDHGWFAKTKLGARVQ